MSLNSMSGGKRENTNAERSFEIQLSEGRKLQLREGNIANTKEDAIFVLNLSATEFPEPGPVFEAIYEKDEALKEQGVSHGEGIWDIMKKAVHGIPNATISHEKDILSGLKYDKATFPPRPYEVMDLDVTAANWPHLKKIYFGNIGSSGKGILVHIWQPISAQEPQLREELMTLFENLMRRLEADTSITSIAMPVLTGHRANSRYFYEALYEFCKTRAVPADLVIYAFKPDDYQAGVGALQNRGSSENAG